MGSDDLLTWLGGTGLATSALILLILLLRRPVARHVGACWAYALWSVTLLPVLLPPSLFALFAEPVLVPMSAAVSPPLADALPSAPRPASQGPNTALAAAWLLGAIMTGALQIMRHLRFLRTLGRTERAAPRELVAVLERARRAAGACRLPTATVSAALESPLVVGLFRARIVVPVDFLQSYGPRECDLVIAHEFCHITRGDLWISAAAELMRALFWFNPLIHLAIGYLRMDQELACDQAVLRRSAAGDRSAYGDALLRTASRQAPSAAASLYGARCLKERLIMLKLHKTSPVRAAAGAALVGFLGFIGIACSAVAAAPQQQTAAEPERGSDQASPSEEDVFVYGFAGEAGADGALLRRFMRPFGFDFEFGFVSPFSIAEACEKATRPDAEPEAIEECRELSRRMAEMSPDSDALRMKALRGALAGLEQSREHMQQSLERMNGRIEEMRKRLEELEKKAGDEEE